MLLQFRVKNYKSFADEIVLDMMATTIREHMGSLLDVNGIKVLPLAAVFGANASGKSNLFKAFRAMCLEVTGAYDKKENHINIRSFIFDDEKRDAPTEFEISVNIDEKEYRYGFVRNQKCIFEEWLFVKKFAKNTKAKEKCVFYRSSKPLIMEGISVKEQKEIEFIASMVTENELILTALGRRKKSLYTQIYEWFEFSTHYQDFLDEQASIEVSAEILYEDEEKKSDVLELLRAFDDSIIDLEIIKDQDADLNDEYEVYSYHLDNHGQHVRIPFSSESSGTQKIFALAVWFMFSIYAGLILFMDELDAKLHPLVLRYLIRLYSDPRMNKANGQLVFSSHNLVCLDSADLRRDEIWFIEKNEQKSTMFSLYDFKTDENAVRSDLNFGKNYLSGRFGAIPFQNMEE